MPTTRQLAAIMFTDIEGYTALMQQDEKKGIETRKHHREIFNQTTGKYKGKILQYYGDGTLSIFSSAIDAVVCGVEMQLKFQSDPKVPVRIGIHTGDIVFSEDDIIGDGVNVASRVESLSVPGSVFISDKVFDEIKNQPEIQTRSMGFFELKNVKKPVEVHAISNPGLIVPARDQIKGKVKAPSSEPVSGQTVGSNKRLRWAALILGLLLAGYFLYLFGPTFTQTFQNDLKSDKAEVKSIAVLAFDNMSNDPEQEYFSDGISEEILNSLVKVNGLNVASRTSSFFFKGKNEDIRAIGEKLDVEMILEGSVRKSGEKVRITAQLINVDDGYHIWSDQFDRDLKDIFAIQEEIADKIAKVLRLTVLKSKGKRITDNYEAYDLFLKGKSYLAQDAEGVEKAMELFQQAVQLDPDFALAHAGIADAYLDFAGYGILPSSVAMQKSKEEALKSISLDKNEPYGHILLAYFNMFYEWDWKSALEEYQKAIDLGFPGPDHFITWYESWINGNYSQAISDAKKILDNHGYFSVEAHWHLGVCNLMGGNYEEALQSFQTTLELNPNYSEGYRWLGKTYSLMGRHDEAYTNIQRALELTGNKGPAVVDLVGILTASGRVEEARKVVEEMYKADEDNPAIEPMAYVMSYTYLGEIDQAFIWLERAFQERSAWVITLRADPSFKSLMDDPRMEEYLQQLNFPN